jgi:hypothetical protein
MPRSTSARIAPTAEMMKTILTALLTCIAACAIAAEPKVTGLTVFTGTWLIDIDANGRATAQYGSTPGDSGYVDEGTIDFPSLLQEIANAKRKSAKETGDRFQIAVQREGETTTAAFTLADDSCIERTLAHLDRKWKPHPIGQRFNELKAKYPIIPKKEKTSEYQGGAYR